MVAAGSLSERRSPAAAARLTWNGGEQRGVRGPRLSRIRGRIASEARSLLMTSEYIRIP